MKSVQYLGNVDNIDTGDQKGTGVSTLHTSQKKIGSQDLRKNASIGGYMGSGMTIGGNSSIYKSTPRRNDMSSLLPSKFKISKHPKNFESSLN